MSKQAIPLFADDISVFARTLSLQLKRENGPPSHLSLMNMLARAAGYRNFQHLRAAQRAGDRLGRSSGSQNIDHRLVERTLFQFDQAGRLRQWPSRRTVQELSLWALWARLPAGANLHERQVNDLLYNEHHFGDPAILRRSLFGMGLVTRERDGSNYRRREVRPPAEARELIRLLEQRRETRTPASAVA
ncbi:DUF2087 domain-containing protein [Devosia nitrariae]|uniref:DUF2087 domain-containing protein n=1 Tax=Devosia nitrariae TaxID=2071872 RepID=A0ABQ5W3I9_9HYPH|nr:DUF2087 domain-containing protein [Devosia nitrariae]GLQ54628.1 hypothetical protein GCM10010862_18870 [Devosia nitrariae]